MECTDEPQTIDEEARRLPLLPPFSPSSMASSSPTYDVHHLNRPIARAGGRPMGPRTPASSFALPSPEDDQDEESNILPPYERSPPGTRLGPSTPPRPPGSNSGSQPSRSLSTVKRRPPELDEPTPSPPPPPHPSASYPSPSSPSFEQQQQQFSSAYHHHQQREQSPPPNDVSSPLRSSLDSSAFPLPPGSPSFACFPSASEARRSTSSSSSQYPIPSQAPSPTSHPQHRHQQSPPQFIQHSSPQSPFTPPQFVLRQPPRIQAQSPVISLSAPPSPQVEPLKPIPPLTPAPQLKFEGPPQSPFEALSLAAAQYTLTSTELQTIVSRAIRLSGKESFIRLLSVHDLDHGLPESRERLEETRRNLIAKYRFGVQRRMMVLQGLHSNAGAGGANANEVVGELTIQLSSICAEQDKLLEELLLVADQQAQLTSQLDSHWASALSVALRKLNGSYARRTKDLLRSKEKITSLEAELAEAWTQAERLASEMNALKVPPSISQSRPPSGEDTHSTHTAQPKYGTESPKSRAGADGGAEEGDIKGESYLEDQSATIETAETALIPRVETLDKMVVEIAGRVVILNDLDSAKEKATRKEGGETVIEEDEGGPEEGGRSFESGIRSLLDDTSVRHSTTCPPPPPPPLSSSNSDLWRESVDSGEAMIAYLDVDSEEIQTLSSPKATDNAPEEEAATPKPTPMEALIQTRVLSSPPSLPPLSFSTKISLESDRRHDAGALYEGGGGAEKSLGHESWMPGVVFEFESDSGHERALGLDERPGPKSEAEVEREREDGREKGRARPSVVSLESVYTSESASSHRRVEGKDGNEAFTPVASTFGALDSSQSGAQNRAGEDIQRAAEENGVHEGDGVSEDSHFSLRTSRSANVPSSLTTYTQPDRKALFQRVSHSASDQSLRSALSLTARSGASAGSMGSAMWLGRSVKADSAGRRSPADGSLRSVESGMEASSSSAGTGGNATFGRQGGGKGKPVITIKVGKVRDEFKIEERPRTPKVIRDSSYANLQPPSIYFQPGSVFSDSLDGLGVFHERSQIAEKKSGESLMNPFSKLKTLTKRYQSKTTGTGR